MSHANMPRLGSWENDDTVTYTAIFDKARKDKGRKMLSPKDHQDNPNMLPDNDPSPPLAPSSSRTKQDEPIPMGAIRASRHHRTNEGSDISKSPSRGENMGQRRGQRPAQSVRQSAGSEQSFRCSQLHRQASKVTGRGGASHSRAWEGRNQDSSHGITDDGRSRLRDRRDESPAIPKFCDLEKYPESAENFTKIFNNHREEKNTGGNVLGTPKHPSQGTLHRPQRDEQKKCCPWW